MNRSLGKRKKARFHKPQKQLEMKGCLQGSDEEEQYPVLHDSVRTGDSRKRNLESNSDHWIRESAILPVHHQDIELSRGGHALWNALLLTTFTVSVMSFAISTICTRSTEGHVRVVLTQPIFVFASVYRVMSWPRGKCRCFGARVAAESLFWFASVCFTKTFELGRFFLDLARSDKTRFGCFEQGDPESCLFSNNAGCNFLFFLSLVVICCFLAVQAVAVTKKSLMENTKSVPVPRSGFSFRFVLRDLLVGTLDSSTAIPVLSFALAFLLNACIASESFSAKNLDRVLALLAPSASSHIETS